MTSAGGKLFRSRHQKQHARGCAHPSTSSSYGSHVSPSFACSVRRTQGSIDCDNMQRDACSSKCQKCAHVNTIHPNVNEARPRFIHSFIHSIHLWMDPWMGPSANQGSLHPIPWNPIANDTTTTSQYRGSSKISVLFRSSSFHLALVWRAVI